MNNGWIKSYRKAQDNEIWQDQNAWRVFQWIIWNVDYATGKGTFGRKQIAEGTGLKEPTVYKVTTRLREKYQAIGMKSNNQFTEISVLHWAKYQQDTQEVSGIGNEKYQVAVMKSNTIKEYKNKEIRIEEDVEQPQKISNRINLTKGQAMAFLKEFQGMTSSELKEQVEKCNDYMNMSSENYNNPGLFLKKWLTRYRKEKIAKESEKTLAQQIEDHLPKISEEERQRNLLKLAEMKKSLKLGGAN